MTEVPHVEAQLAWWPLLMSVIFTLGLLAGFVALAVTAARKGGPAGSTLLTVLLVGGGLALFGLLGFGVVGTRMVASPAPPTVVYVAPAVQPLPVPMVAPPAFPPGSGVARILGPDEVSPGGDVDPAFSIPLPVEAMRPWADIDVAVPTQAVPDWVSAGAVREGDRTYVVVSGRQFADEAAAWQDAAIRATAAVRRDFENAFRPFGSWLLDPNEVRSVAVRNTHTESIRRSAGENEFTVYRTHLRVELSPGVREAIEPIWRRQVSTGRSAMAGGLLVLLTAVAGVLAGYFRLDDRTAGRHRWRLRVGSIAAVALATSVVFGGLATMPIKSVATPATRAPVELAPEVAPPLVAPPEAPRPPGPDDLPQAGVPPAEMVMHWGFHPFEAGPCGN